MEWNLDNLVFFFLGFISNKNILISNRVTQVYRKNTTRDNTINHENYVSLSNH